MLNCTTNKYAHLYAPWLNSPGDLLDYAKWEPGMVLLDLAGGTGLVSREALKRNTRSKIFNPDMIFLLDPNPRVDPPEPMINTTQGYAESLATYYLPNTFDMIVCRQAVGYFNMDAVIPNIPLILKPGGKFVFNSFGRPRPFSFKLVSSDEGVKFCQAHIRIFGHVLHLQARMNRGPGLDFSWFKYHSVSKLYLLLKPYFHIELHHKGNTYRWICTKREETA